ncbi:AGAP007814-PA [Anopheles gambiae str. PEST]|uniref:AGAP007814-PA n=1 Tax=Anopheles gambiae TaxID=7165 RepID=Q5TQ24_ANOGA|nr:AGAP007814-PA [Anopheles gambiae str. PEST]
MRLKRKQKGKRTEVNSIQNRRKFVDPQSGNSCCFCVKSQHRNQRRISGPHSLIRK